MRAQGFAKNHIYYKHSEDRYNFTLSRLERLIAENKKSLNILDIGTSTFTFLIKLKYPKHHIYTLDYTYSFKRRCQEENIKFIHHDLNKKISHRYRNKFDVITFLEVLEHLKRSHSDVLKDLVNMIKPGGYILIETPNNDSLKNWILRFLPIEVWNKFTIPFSKSKEFEHFKEYSFLEIKSLLTQTNGVKIIQAERPIYFDTPSSTLAYRKQRRIFYPLMLLYFYVVRLVPFLRRAMYFCMKRI